MIICYLPGISCAFFLLVLHIDFVIFLAVSLLLFSLVL